jgi:Domain of unknown function (DUF5615)
MAITHLAADENFNNVILRGLLRQVADLDIVRIQDTEVSGADDPTMLEWCASENRILLTHDIKTMAKYAYDRVNQNLPMPGVIEVPTSLAVGQAIEELVLFVLASDGDEWENRVIFLPMQ